MATNFTKLSAGTHHSFGPVFGDNVSDPTSFALASFAVMGVGYLLIAKVLLPPKPSHRVTSFSVTGHRGWVP